MAALYSEGLLLWLSGLVHQVLAYLLLSNRLFFSLSPSLRPPRGLGYDGGTKKRERRADATYRGRRTRTALGILNIHTRSLGHLFEQECALDAQLVELAAQAMQAQAGGVIVVLHLVVAVAQLAAFSAVGLLDGGRERLGNGVCWGHEGFRISLGGLAGALGGHGGGFVAFLRRFGADGGDCGRLDSVIGDRGMRDGGWRCMEVRDGGDFVASMGVTGGRWGGKVEEG